jgi:hypothetical protein
MPLNVVQSKHTRATHGDKDSALALPVPPLRSRGSHPERPARDGVYSPQFRATGPQTPSEHAGASRRRFASDGAQNSSPTACWRVNRRPNSGSPPRPRARRQAGPVRGPLGTRGASDEPVRLTRCGSRAYSGAVKGAALRRGSPPGSPCRRRPASPRPRP